MGFCTPSEISYFCFALFKQLKHFAHFGLKLLHGHFVAGDNFVWVVDGVGVVDTGQQKHFGLGVVVPPVPKDPGFDLVGPRLRVVGQSPSRPPVVSRQGALVRIQPLEPLQGVSGQDGHALGLSRVEVCQVEHLVSIELAHIDLHGVLVYVGPKVLGRCPELAIESAVEKMTKVLADPQL